MTLKPEELLNLAVAAAEDKKAMNVVALDLRGFPSFPIISSSVTGIRIPRSNPSRPKSASACMKQASKSAAWKEWIPHAGC